MLLPGESQGRGTLVGGRLWGRTESDTIEATQQQQQQYNYVNSNLPTHSCSFFRRLDHKFNYLMVLELFKLIVSSCLNVGSFQFSRNWSISPQLLNACAFKESRHMSRLLWQPCSKRRLSGPCFLLFTLLCSFLTRYTRVGWSLWQKMPEVRIMSCLTVGSRRHYSFWFGPPSPTTLSDYGSEENQLPCCEQLYGQAHVVKE